MKTLKTPGLTWKKLKKHWMKNTSRRQIPPQLHSPHSGNIFGLFELEKNSSDTNTAAWTTQMKNKMDRLYT